MSDEVTGANATSCRATAIPKDQIIQLQFTRAEKQRTKHVYRSLYRGAEKRPCPEAILVPVPREAGLV